MSFQPQRILVATDFSEPARAAVDAAADLARTYRAKLTVVHVVPLSSYVDFAGVNGGFTFDAAQFQEAVRRSSDQALAKELERIRASGTDADAVTLDGPAAPEICDLAKSSGADLIVIGSQGRTGLARVFLGSVAENVVRHAAVAVLTVRRR
jgi:nucleotide-binding universal stress UspA family protein